MKNTLLDLNNHLFEQLERLNDDELVGEDLDKEIKRSKSMASLAHAIVSNASLGLQAQRFKTEHGRVELPQMLENK